MKTIYWLFLLGVLAFSCSESEDEDDTIDSATTPVTQSTNAPNTIVIMQSIDSSCGGSPCIQ